MTKNQPEKTRESVSIAVATPTRLARWIEDPFSSMFFATAMTATAFSLVLSGMWLVAALLQ